MNYIVGGQNMIEKLNLYAKDLFFKIAREYNDVLGNDNIQVLYHLMNEEIVTIDNEPNIKLIALQKDQKIHLYQNSPIYQSLKEKEEELLEVLKKKIVPELFRYVIHPIPQEELEPDMDEFYQFLTEGFVTLYAKSFCEKEQIDFQTNSELSNNVQFVEEMLQALPEEVSKDKTVFQYQYPYILELCQIATEQQKSYGINFYSRYEKNYKKDNRVLEEFHYENIKDLLLNQFPITDSNDQITMLLQKYRFEKTVEFAKQDLIKIYETLYANHPDVLNTIKNAINEALTNNRDGQIKSNGNSRILAPTGFLRGSIVVILSVLLGIILSIIILQ